MNSEYLSSLEEFKQDASDNDECSTNKISVQTVVDLYAKRNGFVANKIQKEVDSIDNSIIRRRVYTCWKSELPDENYGRTFEIELPEEKYDWTFEIKSCQTKSMTKLLELSCQTKSITEFWIEVLIIKDTTRILKLRVARTLKNTYNTGIQFCINLLCNFLISHMFEIV
ncbi:hypothetical protein RhiirA5_506516 [Rhizophagus irregularis]|uniref:Uncharacterized protein n=1 Tax=Rhizophagus irregularis TaxID=588596 RepID=A0A2N0NSW3_9GLOM|nr:hypothetical protein RhiirA5_506516 [Rhizophagus irregularis]